MENNNSVYDLIIIGAGPSALALAQCSTHIDKKILIIDRESSIGGCHRVRRVNNYFTEHGPRVYSETYQTFQLLLKEMNVNFYDLFTEYNFNLTEIGGETVFSTLTFLELFKFTIAFIVLTFNKNYGTNILLYDFLIENNFNSNSMDMIDRVCKLTDGGGSDKFTLNEFLQLFNQQFFYKLYQPKLPNDISLFKIWKDYLDKKNVDFLFNINDFKLNKTIDNKINSITINNSNIYGKHFVIATPPLNLNDIMIKSNLPHSWGDLSKYANDTKYIEYISITFHWNKILNLKKIYGFPRNYWGIAFIKLSDYSIFEQKNSKTVISAAITISDVISPRINKTANQCNLEELLNEVYLQLKDSFGDNFTKPTLSILSPGVNYDNKSNTWVSKDTAFITSSTQGFLDFNNKLIPNLYNLGTHNGKSFYKFTSMESAVSNAVELSKVIYPELQKNNYIRISKSYTLTDILNIIILFLIIYLIYLTCII